MAIPAAVLGGPDLAVRVGFLPELGLRAGGGEEGIFQDLKELNWNSITSTSFVRSDAF